MAKIIKSPREQPTVKRLKANKAPSLLDYAWYEKAYQRYSIFLQKPQPEPPLPAPIIRKGRGNNFWLHSTQSSGQSSLASSGYHLINYMVSKLINLLTWNRHRHVILERQLILSLDCTEYISPPSISWSFSIACVARTEHFKGPDNTVVGSLLCL